MKDLITGIGGFAGGHLAEALLADGHSVAGFTLAAPAHPQLERLAGRLDLSEGDVTDTAALRDAVTAFRPDVVYHLAAITHVGQAWDQRRATLSTNVLGTASVLEAAAALDPAPTVLLVSSGQVYGTAPEDSPARSEDDPVEPRSPYAASKACAELLARQAWRGEGLPAVIVRPFNYAGPWQSPDFVCSDFARQIASAELGLEPAEIRVGDLRPVRDFSDVRDVVAGFVLAARHGRPGAAYNLCSGRGVAIREILDRLLELAEVDIRVSEDPGRLRPAEITSLVGDPGRAHEELGWKPDHGLASTLADVLDFWRRRLADAGDDVPLGGPSHAPASGARDHTDV